MLSSLPYIRNEQVAGMRESSGIRPRRSFCIKPKNYRVVDGDTIAVMGRDPEGKPLQNAFRIRFNAVNAPEMPILTPEYYQLLKQGINIHFHNYGMTSFEKLKELCHGRALYVCPGDGQNSYELDKNGRLLAEVCVSGGKGELFEPVGSASLQLLMLEAGCANLMHGATLPRPLPAELERIQTDILRREEFHNSQDFSSPSM